MRSLGAAAVGRQRARRPGRRAQGFDIRSLFTGARRRPAPSRRRRAAPAPATRHAGMERRIRRVRPSADDGGRDPRRGRAISATASRGCGRRPQRRGVSRAALRRAHRGPHARPADHGSDGRPAGVHQVVLGLSRHPGQRRAHRERPRGAGAASRDLRRGREGLRRRPALHRRHLGRRIQLRHPGRRPLGDPLDRDARLHRPPAGLFPRRVSLRAGNPRARRRAKPEQLKGSWAGAFGPTQFMPTSFKRYAVDFDGDGRRDVVDSVARSRRLDRQQPEEGRLGHRADLGLRGRRAAGLQLSARRSLARADDGANGSAPASGAPAARRSRAPTTAPICWCRPARRARAS